MVDECWPSLAPNSKWFSSVYVSFQLLKGVGGLNIRYKAEVRFYAYRRSPRASLRNNRTSLWLANPRRDLFMPLLIDETGWEQRTTWAGEVYYVNLTTKTKHSERPTAETSPLSSTTVPPAGAIVLIPQPVAVPVVVPFSGSADKTVSEVKSFSEILGLG